MTPICPRCWRRDLPGLHHYWPMIGVGLILAGLLVLVPLVNSERTERTERVVVVERVNHGQADANRTRPPSDALLACIRHYESRGNYHATSRSGKYRGAYQFDRRTWNGVAQRTIHKDWYGADPANAPVDIQDSFASQLYRERGLQPWPTPNKRCRGK